MMTPFFYFIDSLI